MIIDDLLTLEAEIKGNPTLNIKGFLNENCGIKVKFKLHKILDLMSSDLKAFQAVRDSLVEKYGKEVVLDKDNPKFKDFIKEINQVSLEEVNLELPKISIEEIPDFNTEYAYTKIFKFLIKE